MESIFYYIFVYILNGKVVLIMRCIKKCRCENCEMLMTNEPIVFIEKTGLSEKREELVGVKCMNYGVYAETPEKLKNSQLLDNWIWI